jgi:hypothetical protein
LVSQSYSYELVCLFWRNFDGHLRFYLA